MTSQSTTNRAPLASVNGDHPPVYIPGHSFHTTNHSHNFTTDFSRLPVIMLLWSSCPQVCMSACASSSPEATKGKCNLPGVRACAHAGVSMEAYSCICGYMISVGVQIHTSCKGRSCAHVHRPACLCMLRNRVFVSMHYYVCDHIAACSLPHLCISAGARMPLVSVCTQCNMTVWLCVFVHANKQSA